MLLHDRVRSASLAQKSACTRNSSRRTHTHTHMRRENVCRDIFAGTFSKLNRARASSRESRYGFPFFFLLQARRKINNIYDVPALRSRPRAQSDLLLYISLLFSFFSLLFRSSVIFARRRNSYARPFAYKSVAFYRRLTPTLDV